MRQILSNSFGCRHCKPRQQVAKCCLPIQYITSITIKIHTSTDSAHAKVASCGSITLKEENFQHYGTSQSED